MTVNRKPTGTAVSIPSGLALGALWSVAVTLAGAAATAKLMETETLSWDSAGYAVLVILLLASWLGAMTAAGKIKRRRLLICLASGGIYFLILLASTALFFGGQYSGVGETGLLILCGSVLGVFMDFSGKSGRNRTKIPMRNR